MRRWGSFVVMAICGVVLAVVQFAVGQPAWGVAMLVFFAVAALIVSPRAFPRSVTAAEALSRSAADGRAIVYWRPGCPFCIRLRTSLGRRATKLHWVDIWSDPEGAAAVRAITGGDETVPTVVAGVDSWVNPAPAKVRELARSAA